MVAKSLPVAYLSQTDNSLNPNGACNVTVVATMQKFVGVKGNGVGQLEDQLYSLTVKHGINRHDAADLIRLFNLKGVKARHTLSATEYDIKRSIDSGLPVGINGYFTRFGHFITIIGYDDYTEDWIVHDPFGEWFADGYDKNNWSYPDKGKTKRYSYGMVKRTCKDNVGYSVIFLSR